MKRILITGATGALGQAIIKQLQPSYDAQVFTTSFKNHSPHTQHRQCDLRDLTQLTAVLDWAAPDLILHLAATFTQHLTEAYQLNVVPASHLLHLLHSRNLKTRILLIGSAAEYGVIKPEENPITEDHALFPVSAYGVSKAWQTQLLGLYANRGVDVVCARVFNLFGPTISETLFAGRIQRQIQAIQAGEKNAIEVGALTAVRDYLATHDAAHQVLRIALHGLTGNIYHVGSGQPISMRDFLMNQLAEHGLSAALIQESPVNSNHQGYDVPVIFADMQKTKKILYP